MSNYNILNGKRLIPVANSNYTTETEKKWCHEQFIQPNLPLCLLSVPHHEFTPLCVCVCLFQRVFTTKECPPHLVFTSIVRLRQRLSTPKSVCYFKEWLIQSMSVAKGVLKMCLSHLEFVFTPPCIYPRGCPFERGSTPPCFTQPCGCFKECLPKDCLLLRYSVYPNDCLLLF